LLNTHKYGCKCNVFASFNSICLFLQIQTEVIRMNMRLGSLFLTVAIGAVLIFSPNLIGGNGLMSYDQAFAEKGGNGKSNSAASNGGAGAAAKSQGQTARNLGALNAGHAAPQAFANAAPNSRPGKIKAYYLASQAAAQTDAAALQGAFEGSAPAVVVGAYKALKADPTNPTLQDAYNQAIADAALTSEQVATLEAAYSAWQDAVAADSDVATTLDSAANKLPVSEATKAALNDLVADSIY
jgi:hypothetical protein